MKKPKSLPYVYLDIDVRTDGTNTPIAIHGNCSTYSPEWPTKCPYFRSFIEPPEDGAECVHYNSGDCNCRQMFRDAMRRFREFIDENLAITEEE